MSDLLLRLQNIHTHIAQYHILHGIDFAVPRGKLTVLLGRNGAGKTTTLRTIMGMWRVTQGAIFLDEKDISGISTPEIAREGIAYVPEDRGIFAGLTVRENMALAARSGRIDENRLARIFTLFPAMKKFWNLPAGALSGGQKQMLAISRAIVEPQKLLLIDEPTKGLAPSIVSSLTDTFLELKQETTILLVEQNFLFARSLGDSVAVLDDGRVVFSGAMNELADDEQKQQQLLGLSLVEQAF